MPVRANTPTGAWRALLITMTGYCCGASGAFAADALPVVLAHLTTSDGLPQAAVMTTIASLLGLVLYRVHRQQRKFQEMARARDRLESEVQLRTRELTESNRQLAEVARAKTDFLDRMSHELRTPMNGVVGMTELLSRTTLSATQTHLTKTIRSSAQILLQIVNDLLDLSKIRAGKVALERLPIDLRQVLEECTSLFAGAAEGKGIELIVCPPAHVEHTLLGDPLRVRQILMNLVGNAVRFTSVGEVVVRADIESLDDGHATVKIRVTDTGIGMDATAIGKIFEPFAQADEITTRKFGGTGLGLAICRELADLMLARITVESRPQIGSTFCLSLPLVVGEARAAGSAQATPQALPSRRIRILSRRPSLEELLSRHAQSLGMVVAGSKEAGDPASEIVVLDASTYRNELTSLLATADSARPALVVVATSAEVESMHLRVQMHEKAIVLKPVHRIAFQEALAVATGMAIPTSDSLAATATNGPLLRGHVLLVEGEAVNAAVAEGYLGAPSHPGLSSVDTNAVRALRKLRGGGSHTDLYPKLVELFRISSANSLVQLRAALRAGDLPIAAAVCHKLAASASNVGALAYGRQARDLEHLCAAGEAGRTKEIYEALQAAHAPLIDALIGHTMRATG